MDERIRKLFVKRMGLILDRRKNDAAGAATRVRQEMNRRGMLHSSLTDLGIRDAYEQTYDQLCREAWSELEIIAVAVGVEPNGSLVDDLRTVFDDLIKPLANGYLSELARQRSTAGAIAGDIVRDAEIAFLRSREFVGTEIERFSISTERRVAQSGGSVHIHHNTFSGPVGGVQQGDHSTATVTQDFAKEGKERVEAVESGALQYSTEAAPPTRLQAASKRTESDRCSEKNEQGGGNQCPSPNTEEGDRVLRSDGRPQQPVATEKPPMQRSAVWKHLTWQRAGGVAALLSAIVAVLVLLFGTNVVGRLVGVDVADGARSDAGQTESPVTQLQPYATYSFKKAPFVHPKIINEFVGYLSDAGDQVIAINLLDSQDSNRYFGEISVTPQEDPMVPAWPWVYTVEGEESRRMDLGELWGVPWYAYRWVGSTQSGLDVLHVRGSGGGAGIFNWVVFTRIEVDHGADYPRSKNDESRTEAVRSETRVRELLRFVGKIPLGDRWLGTVEVNGNDVVVRGRDLYERCELGGVTTMEVVEMAHFEGKDCRNGPAEDPPHARVYEAPAP